MANILAINGSPRANGNTSILLTNVLESIKHNYEGAVCEVVQVTSLDIRGCVACRACYNNKNMKCILNDDMNALFAKMVNADVILLGSPTYVSDVSSQIKAVIDRASYMSGANDKALARKLGAGVVAVRRAGSVHAFNTINNFFLLNDVVVIGSTYWNNGIGWEKGEVENDAEGLECLKRLGENIAWILDKI